MSAIKSIEAEYLLPKKGDPITLDLDPLCTQRLMDELAHHTLRMLIVGSLPVDLYASKSGLLVERSSTTEL
jgi:hypothetical protein